MDHNIVLFRKVLKKTDLGGRLSFPTRCLRKLPCLEGRPGGQTGAADLQIKDADGTVWKFCISIRKKGRYRKPVLGGQWKSFATKYGLGVGDEIKLFKKNGQPHYSAAVIEKKALTLFGSIIRPERLRVM